MSAKNPTKERKALGRGFSALLQPASDIAAVEAASVKQIEIASIQVNPLNPRSHFDEEKLEELAQSIRVQGVIQPVLVRKAKSGYELVAGERRLRACKLAGFTKIPAVVSDLSDQNVLEVALIENIQRADLNAIEEGKAYKNLIEQHGYTQDELARRIGKSRPAIANMMRLLNLPEGLQKDLAEGRLSQGHVRCLLGLDDKDRQFSLGHKAATEGWTVRELERQVQLEKEPKKATGSNPKSTTLDKELELCRQKIENRLATKVRIQPKGTGGSIQLEFADTDDFNRLFSLLNPQ
ncbi:MAG: ParB/RepB/Spo0J family partition protein [bacterium]|nr:ParB/RepB/Spo0J family partition protein [bacterium]